MLVGLIAISVCLSAWTIWALWFKRNDKLDRRVYTTGVSRFGVALWMGESLLVLDMLSHLPLVRRVVLILALLPLSLWLGYVWGRVMTALLPAGRPK
jgi:hypothetical protein